MQDIQLAEGMEWIGEVWFAVILGILMVVEVVVDKIPHIAHAAHIVLVVVRTQLVEILAAEKCVKI